MRINLSKLGPGLLFAGAAIGVSHLVQSTRAGADYGWGLIWALLLINLFKYPFFQYGPRYAQATGETLLDGYHKLGKGYLWAYFFINLGTMFTIQSAVTVVTAGLASKLFGITEDIVIWSVIITLFCSVILVLGRFHWLDKFIKVIMISLAISSVLAVGVAFYTNDGTLSFQQIFPSGSGLLFLIAFLGWMPAPLDISIWHSIWTLEKNKIQVKRPSLSESLFDFNVGYIATTFLALCFLGLGALVMFGTGIEFSNQGGAFAGQLIQLYTSNLGEAAYGLIAVAAFSTMLSTTITTLDASPRAMSKTIQLLIKKEKSYYIPWLLILGLGTGCIFLFLLSEMGQLVQIATVLSFITAPLYAFLNFRLVLSKQMPREHQPKKGLKVLSIIGLLVLTGFTLFYLFSL
ncbi:Nramp family divalent metal transporter [Flavobacteriaceae bacterium]|jgi:Mn2+/Fe2+ NRAMP family transporter|nr:Nramp family divalent metal transporter [Flavobacteriaceae bacterium]MDC0916294.1 Nramp family divalent metal transporter [Flavobacteriaceae bacterium]MDC3329471.1 Nramp family divalent metal transporter [Flavobacteriaceae bacterium]